MSKEKKYYVSRYVTQTDRTHYGPFTFAEAMHCMEEWRHTGDALALTDSDYHIIPEFDYYSEDEEMEVVQITAADIENGRIKDESKVADCKGHIEIEAGLGIVFASQFRAAGHIWADSGSGIEAGYSIRAGEGIKAGEDIHAGYIIKAGYGIEAGCGIKAGYGIRAGESIHAGEGIEAGCGIKAGYSIRAGESIHAGEDIEAGEDIHAAFRIFAGLATSLKSPTKEQCRIRCKRLAKGEVCYGELVETSKLKEVAQ